MKEIESDVVYARLVKGVASFFRENGKDRAVVGLSGGIDSAVVLCIAAEALGRENVHAVLMPSPFSTLHSVTDAIELASNLNISYNIVPIEAIFNRYTKELEEFFCDDIKDIKIGRASCRERV